MLNSASCSLPDSQVVINLNDAFLHRVFRCLMNFWIMLIAISSLSKIHRMMAFLFCK